ncbi:hypothetical protein CCHL11_06939 [Colletotrichum chlorophyti]|uniref:Uncharacterized protein n=1 Tax=Colletotrichum chlorophyti TaxID=708187 RepID=A0A1Q8RC45_9PEZI|nr:hypothetical protein CCHL11_06939 [Colletotrichum chlorophyti]
MGLITGLVSTAIHAAMGRNPYSHNHNQQFSNTQGGAISQGNTLERAHDACAAPGSQPCSICAVVTPLGKGREQRLEKRMMKHERRVVRRAVRDQRYAERRRYGHGSLELVQHGQWQAGPATGQEDGVEMWRRASMGDVPPPAYEEGDSSRAYVRRSVEVFENGVAKRGEEKA